MKKTIINLLLFCFLYAGAYAQSVTPNPSLSEKDQEKALKITKRLSERRSELLKLEGKLDEANRKVEKTEKEAKESAEDNAKAASTLNKDVLDKKNARKAKRKADNAANTAKAARKAAKASDRLKDDINSLRKKIARDSTTLEKLNNLR